MTSSSSSDGDSSSSSAEANKKEKKAKAEKEKKEDVVVSSGSGDDSDSDSSSSQSSEKKKKKKKKDKKEKKKKKEKKSAKDKKAKKEKGSKKKGKKEKKDKKDSKKAAKKRIDKAKRDAVSNQFGKYGMIKAEDFFNKKAEFLCWAMEVRKANTDALGQMQLKDLFKEYIEDYNTATMPSKKYYNLQVWDSEQARKRHKKIRSDDMTDGQRAALASFDDERARKEEIKNLQMKKQEHMLHDEVRRMRGNKDKVADMRNQDRLRAQRDTLNKGGFTAEAEKINARLAPERRRREAPPPEM